MKLKELLLKHYGKFTEKRISLEDGINVVYGENESGKTTVHTFLNSMLFGLERGRGRAAASDTFRRYEPWENAAYYSGSLKFTCGGRTFCLERNFDKQTRRASLYCEEDGEELSLEDGDLTVLLDGMEKGMFEETIGMAQRSPETGEALAKQLKNYATNYYAAGDQTLQLGDALQALRDRQKELERQERKKGQERQDQREELELNMSYLWRDIHRLTEELERVQADIAVRAEEEAAKKQKYEEFYRQKAEEARANASKWRVHPIEYVGMFIIVVLLFFILKRPWSYLWAIVVSLLFGIYVWNRMKDGKKKPDDAEMIEELAEPEKPTLEKLSWEEERIQGELKEKQVYYGNLQEQLEELETQQAAFTADRKKLEALKMAQDRLVFLSDEMRREVGSQLNEKASRILSEITEGRYERIWVSEDLEVSLQFEGRRINMMQVSRGTLEQIYFAVRMAAQEVLFEEELPVILDDAFAYYDDRRLMQTLMWLCKNRKQVVIFTCQSRELTMLQAAGLPYHEVRL